MCPGLHLTLLGDFALGLDDEPVPTLDAPRLQALLAFLVVRRDAPQPRRRIAFLFWPDSTERQARTNLRRELHHLRQALPDAGRYLRVTHGALQWRSDAPCRVDVVEFEAAIEAAAAAEAAGQAAARRTALERAVSTYGGDLLPNCYDSWIDEDRDGLRRAYERALDGLIAECERARDYPAALQAAERRVSHDPLREASHARLMRLHAAAGDRAAALRAYERCEAILDRELGMEPGPALRQARSDLLVDSLAPGAPEESPGVLPATEMPDVGEASPLVGRGEELSAIQDWVAEASAQAGQGAAEVLLLLGEPGIGKTRLLDELAASVRSSAGLVIRGRGFEAETVRPYGAWIDALRSVPRDWIVRSGELSFLPPELRGSASAPSDRSRLFDAVAIWLSDLATHQGPVAVLIDDIQWLDEASAALFHYVTRLQNRAPILLACAARPAEADANRPASGLLRGLHRSRRVRRVDLGPMDREQIAALAHRVDSAIDTDRVYDESGGNPLFALEVAHALAGRTDGGSASLEDLVHNRLARLDDTERELLAWAAALGRGFDPATAALVADRPLPDLLPTLERLERHGILRPADSSGGVSYDFGHDIVRRAAYAAISEPRRRLMHLRIARALDDVGDPEGDLAGDIAHHAALGGDPALAASAAVTAGLRCLRIFAYSEAEELAHRGIELTRGLPEAERIRLHLGLLRVRLAAGKGQNDRAARLEDDLRALIADARALGSLDLEAIGHSLLSVLNYDRDDLSRVHQSSIQAAEALDTGGGRRPQDLLSTARTLSQTGTCLASIGREMTRAEALLLEAEALADRLDIQLIDIPMGLGIVRLFQAAHDEAVRLLERGLRMARAEQDHFRACECLVALVTTQLETGDPGRAQEYCRQLLPVAARLKEGSEAPYSRALDALARYVSGDAAGEELAGSLDTLRRMDTPRKLAHVQVHAAEADFAAGRIETALDRADEALAAARVVGHRSGMALAGALLVRCARALEDPRRSQAELQALRALRAAPGSDGDLSVRAREAVAALGVEDYTASRA
jgi:DNA-binding SARP family transcriptional activator